MAVYGETITLPGLAAGGNLSAVQYKVVKLASTAGQVIVVNATTDVALGILQNDPDAAGQPALVAALGVAKAIVGVADLVVGEHLGFNSTGQLVDHATDNRRKIGIALEPSTAVGDIVRVLLQGLSRY